MTLHEAALRNKISSTPDQMVENFFNLAELVAFSDSVRQKRDITAAFTAKTKLMVQSVTDYDQIRKELMLSLGRTAIERGYTRAKGKGFNLQEG